MNYQSCNRTENIAAALVVVFSSVTGCLGNALVIVSYYYSSYLRQNPGNCFIINLALSDFLNAVYIQIPCIVNLVDPKLHFKDSYCVIHSILTWSLMTASNWLLAIISIDRAIAMNRPFQYRNIVTKFKVRCTVAIVWIFSFVISGSLIRGISSVSYKNWELMCSPKWNQYPESFIALLLCFLCPFIILLLCNCSIIVIVKKLNSVLPLRSPETGLTADLITAKENIKTRRSLYVIVIVYLFFVVPYYAAKFTTVKFEEDSIPTSVFILYMQLMFLSSALNPFIYAVLRKDHRKAMLKTMEVIMQKYVNLKTAVETKLEQLKSCCG